MASPFWLALPRIWGYGTILCDTWEHKATDYSYTCREIGCLARAPLRANSSLADELTFAHHFLLFPSLSVEVLRQDALQVPCLVTRPKQREALLTDAAKAASHWRFFIIALRSLWADLTHRREREKEKGCVCVYVRRRRNRNSVKYSSWRLVLSLLHRFGSKIFSYWRWPAFIPQLCQLNAWSAPRFREHQGKWLMRADCRTTLCKQRRLYARWGQSHDVCDFRRGAALIHVHNRVRFCVKFSPHPSSCRCLLTLIHIAQSSVRTPQYEHSYIRPGAFYWDVNCRLGAWQQF